MLREHVQIGDNLGRDVQHEMQAGNLVSDELVNRLVEERIEQPDSRNGFILDGYPRTLRQAEVLTKLLKERQLPEVVVHLKETIIKLSRGWPVDGNAQFAEHFTVSVLILRKWLEFAIAMARCWPFATMTELLS